MLITDLHTDQLLEKFLHIQVILKRVVSSKPQLRKFDSRTIFSLPCISNRKRKESFKLNVVFPI